MADHKFTVDLSGLDLNQTEQAQISGALQRAAINEIATMSTTRGQGAQLDLQTKLFPGTHGGRIITAFKQASAGANA